MSEPKLEVTVDLTEDFEKIIKQFKNDAVLVGIPEEDADRKQQEEDGEMTNAALLAINEFGSPANNIPPRPVMEIGLLLAQEDIASELRKAVLAAFSGGGATAMEKYYNRAGLLASQSIKQVINKQYFIAPPSEATIAARKAKGFKGTKSLIVTGQMRNAITWVVNKWGF
jgi:hypothetical protein